MNWILENVDFVLSAPFYLGYILAVDKFCKKYLGVSKRNELMFVIVSFGSWLLWNIVDRLNNIPYPFSVAHGVIFFAVLVLLFQSEWEKRILAASISMLALRLGYFSDSFLSCLILAFRHAVQKITEPVLNEWEIGLVGCVDYCLGILAVLWLSKHLESVFYGKRRKWYCFLAVPLIMLIAVFEAAEWGASNGVMVRSGGNMGLYYDQIFSHAEFLVLALLSMAATGFYVFGMNRIYLEQERSSRYHSQIAVYKMLAEQYSQTERLRHDMKNHIIALSGLFEGREWEKLGDYLKRLEKVSLETGGDITGNKAVDALLYQKRKRAEEENIKWECDVQMPKGYCIDEFDLCVLFGNILDNALNACGGLQCDECHFINIQARTVKKCFLLEVKNSMDMTEKYTDGFANKYNPQGHGIGLQNVGDVVKQYNGAVNIEAEQGVFAISVLIPLNDAPHDRT
ncbi:MAG: GHKL domain-containing protein [Butyrivibrio sp.]|nr:GHKL domain-containing protein [Muribaculum sp.]MCM1553397.1 GHKL domain-containing protein [Butyrivibrio sp.]